MTQVRHCNNCSSKVSDLDQFCSHCGASVGATIEAHGDDGTKYYNPIQTPGRAKLTMISGTGILSGYNLGSQCHVAGRSRGEIIFADDVFVSPSHCSFTYTAQGLQLKDEGSLNGTFLRKEEVILGEEPLDIIAGKQLFRIEPIQLSNHYMGPEETMRFVSPVQDYKFRVVHILSGGSLGKAVCSPNNNVVIGRIGCDCTVDDDLYLSPRHVQIKEEEGVIKVRDLGSKNGTFFRINSPTLLKNGDYVQIGSEIIRVEINS